MPKLNESKMKAFANAILFPSKSRDTINYEALWNDHDNTEEEMALKF